MSIEDEVLAFIAGGVEQAGGDARFNDLALGLFERQFARNEPYRNFCLARGVTPGRVSQWAEVPAVPTAAFKEAPMACFPIEQAAAVYESSGTTGSKRSKHYLRTLELYEASLKPNFEAHVLPDGASLPMLAMALPGRLAPHSSLTHMLEVVIREYGGEGSAFYLDERGLDGAGLTAGLRSLDKRGKPACLVGTAFAFVHLLDYCQDLGLRFDLAPGSRLMDTGGYKGRSRAVPKDELHRLYERVLGVPADHVVNEYGMTEMGSQFYDSALRDAQMRPRTEATPIPALRQAQGRPFPRRGGRSETGRRRPRHKTVPPWVRTVIVDVETMQPAPKCVVGLLRHYDLANVDSVMAVQTDDLGIALEDGFEIVGRASGAEARGCSIAVDELLTRATGP